MVATRFFPRVRLLCDGARTEPGTEPTALATSHLHKVLIPEPTNQLRPHPRSTQYVARRHRRLQCQGPSTGAQLIGRLYSLLPSAPTPPSLLHQPVNCLPMQQGVGISTSLTIHVSICVHSYFFFFSLFVCIYLVHLKFDLCGLVNNSSRSLGCETNSTPLVLLIQLRSLIYKIGTLSIVPLAGDLHRTKNIDLHQQDVSVKGKGSLRNIKWLSFTSTRKKFKFMHKIAK
ncbi:hypothetical protein BRADI_1g60650v3 [Brachypodium distachyon]|uniref:Uncharacterized protein n=1 Tax=Brachypodium distachyon TaxID=15368 RepID=A0A2K2DSN5_BRADI|nr:hypothetical protein BRADI_1g60650v3 [Brachypodium distachyon]PNT77291.1 hypothetical protein BRADI_1g60650v3 [Brachypodium distachyon]